MPGTFDVYGKIYEIISNLQEYNSPEKIEDLKSELKFIQENDDGNNIYIADYGESIPDIVNTASPSDIGYVFCLPGCVTGILAGSLYEVPSNVRLVPVSTAFAGADFANVNIQNRAFLAGAYMADINFAGADLSEADLTGSDVSGGNFSGVNLYGAKLRNTNFARVTLQGATMPEIANTKESFKSVVGTGNWHPTNTIWIDGSTLKL